VTRPDLFSLVVPLRVKSDAPFASAGPSWRTIALSSFSPCSWFFFSLVARRPARPFAPWGTTRPDMSCSRVSPCQAPMFFQTPGSLLRPFFFFPFQTPPRVFRLFPAEIRFWGFSDALVVPPRLVRFKFRPNLAFSPFTISLFPFRAPRGPLLTGVTVLSLL